MARVKRKQDEAQNAALSGLVDVEGLRLVVLEDVNKLVEGGNLASAT